jgi:hypothetical protein
MVANLQPSVNILLHGSRLMPAAEAGTAALVDEESVAARKLG